MRQTIDPDRLNNARWIACNTRYTPENVPTMEAATALADAIVCAYLGMLPEEFAEAVAALPTDPGEW